MAAQRGALRPLVEQYLAGREATADEVFAHAQAAGLRHTHGTVMAHLHDGTQGPARYRRVGPSRFTLAIMTAPAEKAPAEKAYTLALHVEHLRAETLDRYPGHDRPRGNGALRHEPARPARPPGRRAGVDRPHPMSAALPTPTEVLAAAAARLDAAVLALSDCRDELASDWRPGMELTDDQAAARRQTYDAIGAAKREIEPALWALRDATRAGGR